MLKGIQYLQNLKKANSYIQRLSYDVDMYERNKQHLRDLIDEYNELRKVCDDLSAKYNQSYLPALEQRHRLRSELELAQSNFEMYLVYLQNETKDLTNEGIKELLLATEASKGPRIKDLKDSDSITDSESVSSISVPDFRSSTQSESSSHKSVSSASSRSSRYKSWGSWSIESVTSKLTTLEARYAELSKENRSTSKNTSLLTSQLKFLQDEISNMHMAMRVQPETMYESVENEIAGFKVRALKQILENRERGVIFKQEEGDLVLMPLSIHKNWSKRSARVCSLIQPNDGILNNIIY